MIIFTASKRAASVRRNAYRHSHGPTIGKIGDTAEQGEAAAFIAGKFGEHGGRFIAGQTAPPGRRMRHQAVPAGPAARRWTAKRKPASTSAKPCRTWASRRMCPRPVTTQFMERTFAINDPTVVTRRSDSRPHRPQGFASAMRLHAPPEEAGGGGLLRESTAGAHFGG